MESQCVSVCGLNDRIRGWIAKLVVVEKTLFRRPRNSTRMFFRVVFADASGDTIQGITYLSDLDAMDCALELHGTYYIANATIQCLRSSRMQIGMVPYEIIISHNTVINRVLPEHALSVENFYELTRFCDLDSLRVNPNARITLLGVAVYAGPAIFYAIGNRQVHLQEFIILNEERIPIVFSVWDDYFEDDGMHLVELINERPVVMICRPRISHLHGLSIATQATTIIMYNPNLLVAQQLRHWYDTFVGDTGF
ncbi:replication protein A 70 kDa DNA-binding subunit B-like [Coffea arabica]|uniref:Replication protein A 70 kDa DNA-binding subunit B-like n=1 Tax=Coffea arabica TaxID=13443 RepID=A0ABM4WV94_COFAR